MKRRLFAVVCFLLLLNPKTHSQKIEDLLTKDATELKVVFKDSDIAALSSFEFYEYFVDPFYNTLRVRKKQMAKYVSLKSNAKLTLRNYFNDHIKIESYSLKNEKGKKLNYDEFCGHVDSEGVFYSDGQICLYHAPLLLMGQSANYENSVLFTDPRYFTQAFFNDYYPARNRQIIFKIPNSVKIDLIEMNFAGYNIEKITKEGDFTIHTYTLLMAESHSEDDNLPGHLHYAPHLLVLCKAYTSPKGEEKIVLSTTDDLYKWYTSLTAKLDTNYQTLKPIVTELTHSLTSDEEKIKAIYYWVQDNIKYIAFEDGIAAFKPDDAKNVFYKRYGDCKGMANLTKAMMTVAGFDARLTWIGTDKIPYPYSLPTLAVDNHMICTVFSDGKKYILDATEKGNPMGKFAERIQGKEVLIEDGSKYLLDKVPNEPMDYYLEESVWKLKLTDKKLEGKGETTVKGERKKELLFFLAALKTTDRQKFLERFVAGKADYKQFHILNSPSVSRDSLLRISSEAKLENQVYSNLKELYIDMDFDDTYTDSQVKKDRKTPYKFGYRVFKKLRTELIIPPEYTISHLPESLHIKNSFYEFDLSYQSVNNMLVYKKEIRILNNTLPAAEIATWNKTIQDVKNFYNNQIILKEK